MPDQPDRTGSPARLVLLEPGGALGSFRLVSLIGEGGMGRVFVAEDTRLGRKVALKVMMPHLAKEERARKMFLREARSAAAVGHDRVVTIHEAAEADGVPYIAMELLAGEPLNAFLSHTPCPPLQVSLAIAYQVAEGLDAAHSHEQKLIHRDIKPANVWLRATPGKKGIDVRLLDFGLARAADGDTLSTGNAGKALGTPLYMAPEQWDGKGVDHQSDIYSLGVMLYQMLTGEPPFQGDSVKELMFQICMPAVVPTPPAEVNPAVPADVSAFVLRMIAKAKAERVATAAEVMRALEAFLHPVRRAAGLVPAEGERENQRLRRGQAPPLVERELLDPDTTPLLRETRGPAPATRAEPRSSRGRGWWLVAGGVVLAAVVAAVVFPGGKPAPTETARQTVTAPATNPSESSPRVAPATRPAEPAPAPPPTRTAPPPTRPAPVVPSDPPPKVRPPLLDCTGPAGASAAAVKASQQAWASYLGRPVEYPVDPGVGVSMVFVLVPPGTFLMGTTVEELDALAKVFPKTNEGSYTDEMPQHAVTITKPMYVGKTEVTERQFYRHTPAAATKGAKPDRPDWREYNDTHPVVNVNWDGSKAFADWVGKRALPAGFGSCRLPTEAEWEYACRAGTRGRYPHGSNDPESLVTIANVEDVSYKKKYPTTSTALATDDGYANTAPVGKYEGNRFGLHDMIGNVWEWCGDGYAEDAYKYHDPINPFTQHSDNRRVLRGGSWNDDPWLARPAVRTKSVATGRTSFNGCRLVLPQNSD